jgi:glucose/arabinose dehydrogenase
MRKILLICIACLFLLLAKAQPVLSFQEFSSGYVKPLGFINCGDSRNFVIQQNGNVFICDAMGVKNPNPFLNISSKVNQTGNERGLLGMAFDPNYTTNGYFYVNYTASTAFGGYSVGSTVVARYQVSANPDKADSLSETIVMRIFQPYTNHNGGWMEFGNDGFLYIGMGDGGSAGDPEDRAQDPDSLLGKILRINVSTLPYTIPTSNPYASGTSPRPEIWAMGIRNPWRFSFDRLNGDLYIGDVGQNAQEEIDYEPAGSAGGFNYGWRCKEGTANYDLSGGCTGSYTAPIQTYSHAGGNCSVTGGNVYRGSEFPGMYGYYISADYCSGKFYYAKKNTGPGFTTGTLTALTTFTNNITSFGENKDGELFLCAHSQGKIYRVKDTTCSANATITNVPPVGQTSLADCSVDTLKAYTAVGYAYKWKKDGAFISGETDSILLIPGNSNQGFYQVEVTVSPTCKNLSDSMEVEICLGLNDIDADLKLSIYPNPTDNISNIQWISDIKSTYQFSLYQIDGKKIYETEVKGTGGIKIQSIEMNSLANGIYLLEIKKDNILVSQRKITKN